MIEKRISDMFANNYPKDDLVKLLYDATDAVIQQYQEARLDAAIYLFFQQSVVENIPLKAVYERYYVKEIPTDKTLPYYTDKRSPIYMCPRIEYECDFKLQKRLDPLEVTETDWLQVSSILMERLRKELPTLKI